MWRLSGSSSTRSSRGITSHRGVRRVLAGIAVITLATLGLPVTAAAVTPQGPIGPANDDFANAAVLPGTGGAFAGTNVDATKEAGEPNHAGNPGGASVWWSWSPPTNGLATIDLTGSGFDTLLGVYTGGPVHALAEIASDDDGGAGFTSRVEDLKVRGDTTYFIAVDGFDLAARAKGSRSGTLAPEDGSITGLLTFVSVPGPPNDDFANAEMIVGGGGAFGGSTAGATAEFGEPDHALSPAGASAWWEWTAPGNGTVTIDLSGSDFDTVLAMYVGGPVNNLAEVASDDDGGAGLTSAIIGAPVTAGQTYFIAVDGFDDEARPEAAKNVVPLVAEEGTVTGLLTFTAGGPPNDDFADAVPIALEGFFNGNNAGAGAETGEPAHAGSGPVSSVWWLWTAPSDGMITVDTFGSDFDTLLAVYTGSAVDSLTEVASNDNAGGGIQSEVVDVPVSGGTVYHIAVDGFAGQTGTIPGSLAFAADRPPNDDFAAAEILPGAGGAFGGSTVNATIELGEPLHAGLLGGASVWYAWTAPGTGFFDIDLSGSDFDTLLAVYEGPTVDDLTVVAFDDDGGTGLASFVDDAPAIDGRTYMIAVDGVDAAARPASKPRGPDPRVAETGTITGVLTFTATGGPANDDFANAEAIPAGGGAIAGDNTLATKELGEPDHAGNPGGASLWWSFTPPADGLIDVTLAGSTFDTLLALHRGSSVDALTPLDFNDDAGGTQQSAVTGVDVVTGVTYFIAVDGFNGATGTVVGDLTFTPAPVPPNDDFANAEVIGAGGGVFAGTNIGASKEPGEPDHASNPGGASVWWSWTAPDDGTIDVDTFGSDLDTTLGIYNGASVNALTEVASSDDSGGPQSQVLGVPVAPGTTYFIAVDGFDRDVGAIAGNLVFTPTPPPGNDDFANAVAVGAGAFGGPNVNATKETGEPDHAGIPGGASVWWSFTPPSNGVIDVSLAGSDFDTTLGVYTGTAVDALTEIASNDDSAGTQSEVFDVAVMGGTVYFIAVDGFDGDEGTVVGNITFTPDVIVLCDGLEATIVGTAGDDILTGSPGPDVIAGLEGNDLIEGKGDDDVICGGPGTDEILGGAGNDLIFGDEDDDTLNGGPGEDELHGGLGDDLILGTSSNDELHGEDGNDILKGGAGDDLLFGGEGNDRVKGGADNDELHGGPGRDTVNGEPGDDIGFGDEGDDRMFGFGGDDELHGGDGKDRVTGGAGFDTLFGDAGDDIVRGGGDDDFLDGGADTDDMNGQAGTDTCINGEAVKGCEAPRPGPDASAVSRVVVPAQATRRRRRTPEWIDPVGTKPRIPSQIGGSAAAFSEPEQATGSTAPHGPQRDPPDT